ncbi:hypothetical protein YC2023_017403 [Brassica napus]
MDEPVKMKKRVDQGKLNIIAIFYKVCARDVKKQTCEFGEIFWKLTRASSGDQVKMWKECVSNKICLSKTRDSGNTSLNSCIHSSIPSNVSIQLNGERSLNKKTPGSDFMRPAFPSSLDARSQTDVAQKKKIILGQGQIQDDSKQYGEAGVPNQAVQSFLCP